MNINSNEYFKKYFLKFLNLCNFRKDFSKFNKIKYELIKCKKRNKKIAIFGKGGSAAISSHFSVDLTKIAKVRCVNFNESDLITCFANDYGYENWIKKVIEFYLNKGDVLILVSSSGISKKCN